MSGSGQSRETYTVSQDGEEFLILEYGEPVATPMGQRLRTRFQELAEEIADDLERQGPDPTAGVSMYTCLCSCLDFGLAVGRQELIDNALPALRDDPVLHTSADPEIMFTQMAAYAQSYFSEHGVREMLAGELVRWARKEMAPWSMQEIMVVQMVGAHIGSPLMGMALAQDKVSLEPAAFGFCRMFWAHRMEGLRGIVLGGLPGFYPQRADESYCEDVCLAAVDEADGDASAPADFLEKCGVVLAFDVWRRFAAYGRLQRLRGGAVTPADIAL